jgi:raffinose/stachyose/melibiose transport system permease protein
MTRLRRTRLLEISLWLVACVFAMPMLMVANIALRSPTAPGGPLSLAWPPTLDNIVAAWTTSPLAAAMANSLVITTSTVLLSILLGAPAAYAIGRSSRSWSKLTYGLFLVGLLVPGQLGMLPLYQTMRDLGLLASIPGLVLVHVGGSMSFTIFLFTTFVRGLSTDCEEAALLDGCNPIRTFVFIVFPMLRPVSASVVILTAVFTWNAFLIPLLYVGATGLATVPVTMSSYVGEQTTNVSIIFGAILLSILPLLITYFFLQKSVIQGFAGGLKI